MAREGSDRKAGGERPKALGEKDVEWERWSEADWMGKMEEREGEG
jgi:hypothetical protein